MDRYDIEERIFEAGRVIATWPNPMAVLRYKTSMPDVIRDEKDWLSYNTESSRDNLKVRFTPDSKQHQEAIDVLDWLSFCSKRAKVKDRKIIRAIIQVYCSQIYNNSYGFGELSKDLRRRGIKMGRETIRRKYNQAMGDLEFVLQKGLNIKALLK